MGDRTYDEIRSKAQRSFYEKNGYYLTEAEVVRLVDEARLVIAMEKGSILTMDEEMNAASDSCPFCERLEMFRSDAESYMADAEVHRHSGGVFAEVYKAVLIQETYLDGTFYGLVSSRHFPLNYCPVCGVEIE